MRVKHFALPLMTAAACFGLSAIAGMAADMKAVQVTPKLKMSHILCLDGFQPSVANPDPSQGSYFCQSPAPLCANGFLPGGATVKANGAFRYDCNPPPPPPE